MEKVDGLSKRSDQKVELEKDNENKKLIKKAREKNNEVVRVVEKIKKVEVKVLRDEEWQVENNLVLKEGKVYIPRDKELRAEIIQLHYDILVARHRK